VVGWLKGVLTPIYLIKLSTSLLFTSFHRTSTGLSFSFILPATARDQRMMHRFYINIVHWDMVEQVRRPRISVYAVYIHCAFMLKDCRVGR